MKIAILYDVDGWAYHAEARGMAKFMRRYSIKCDLHRYPAFNKLTQKDRNQYDGVFLYPRQAPLAFPAEKTIVKFSSFGNFSNQGSLNSTDFRYIVCTNKEIHNDASKALGHLNSNIIYMPLCIDSDVFYPKDNISKTNKKLVVGFAGNSNRKGKGFDIIEESIKKLGSKVIFKTATYHGKDRLKYEDMPDFYRSLDLLICMSTAEGGPLTSFESGLCGVPTINGCKRSAISESTIDDYNVFEVERNSDALVKKILELDKNREKILVAKKNIYETMYFNHSWSTQARAYARLLEKLNMEK